MVDGRHSLFFFSFSVLSLRTFFFCCHHHIPIRLGFGTSRIGNLDLVGGPTGRKRNGIAFAAYDITCSGFSFSFLLPFWCFGWMIASWTYPKKDRVKMEGYRLKTLVYIYVLALVGLVHRTSKFRVFFSTFVYVYAWILQRLGKPPQCFCCYIVIFFFLHGSRFFFFLHRSMRGRLFEKVEVPVYFTFPS